MTDVLLLARNDWANAGWRVLQCLQHLGIDSKLLIGKSHTFSYPQEGTLHPALGQKIVSHFPISVHAPDLASEVRGAKVVHFLSSTFVDLGAENALYADRYVIVQHAGTTYRRGYTKCNDVFNRIANRTIVSTPDLLGLGAVNELYLSSPLNTDELTPQYYEGDRPVRVAHYPSKAGVKGTERIRRALEQMKKYRGNDFGFDISVNTVSWPENIKRMRFSDIYIDGLKQELKGRPYGAWGRTTLEAAALGSIVLTHGRFIEPYRALYGTPPWSIIDSLDSLTMSLNHYLDCPKKELVEKQAAHREWVERHHSIPAAAEMLWERVYREALPNHSL